jgi:hypothetical protein
MSNFLAIATVTATLQRILQAVVQLDVPGARVTTVRPDASGSGTPEVGVNIYLYQATPNPAWRNYDLRNRRPKGELIKQAQAGLDLYYIMTFYGNEVELEPQRLLGSAVRTIVDYPILTPEMIRETANNPTFSFLANSTLDKQVERVTIVPTNMNTEELSKIWSVFFQSPYVLSFACQGGAVLIEGQRQSGRPLPIRRREFYTTPSQPSIFQIVSEAGVNQPVVASSSLTIRGQSLNPQISDEQLQELESNKPLVRSKPQVKIGETRVTPDNVRENEISLELSSLSAEEKNSLRAGIQSLQIVYSIAPKRVESEPERIVGSNVMPFVLCPTIAEVEVEDLEDNGDETYSAKVKARIDLTVGGEQRVLIFLNERSTSNPAAYIFEANSRTNNSTLVTFPIRDVKEGDYLVRLQIDGAESPLNVDVNSESETYEQFVSPAVTIGF